MYFRHLGLIPERTKDEPTDWLAIERSLIETRRWTPQQISAMTIPELYLACGEQPVNEYDAWALVRAAKKLTPLQKLELAKLEQEYSG